MGIAEEINNLNTLLADGAITQAEYDEIIKNFEPEKVTGSTDDSNQTPIDAEQVEKMISKSRYLRIIERRRNPNNVIDAGKTLRQHAILSFINIIISIFLYFTISYAAIRFVVTSKPEEFALSAILILVSAIIMLICIHLIYKTGSLLIDSESRKERKVVKIKIAKKNEATGALKVGQSFDGGIYLGFDKHGKYALICAKNDLPIKMNNSEAKSACEYYVHAGFNNWFLPNYDELKLAYRKLHKKGLGDFKNDKYVGSELNLDFKNNMGFAYAVNEKYLVRPMRFAVLR